MCVCIYIYIYIYICPWIAKTNGFSLFPNGRGTGYHFVFLLSTMCSSLVLIEWIRYPVSLTLPLGC